MGFSTCTPVALRKTGLALQPSLGDFNGDGNVDIAVFSAGEGGSRRLGWNHQQLRSANRAHHTGGEWRWHVYPIQCGFQFRRPSCPPIAGNIKGDPRSDFVEMDSYSSSFDVISAQSGPTFGLALASSPVIGATGSLQVTLTFPSASSTVVQLSSSEPNISIPSTVTVPAGTVSQNVPFQIGTAFNPNHVFALTGQLGSETHTAYGTQTTSAAGSGFVVEMLNPPINPPAVVASGSTTAYQVVIASLAVTRRKFSPRARACPAAPPANSAARSSICRPARC